MSKILILFAHPALEKSRVHRRLIRNIKSNDTITFRDLYEQYPDFDIDIQREQSLLLEHDIIIWQHPFYWYSAPAMIKQWLDLVLEHGWAYGKNGHMLAGKQVLNVISCGGSKEVYCHEGRNRFTIRELLAPFEQTARLCQMNYLPPFVIHGTHKITPESLEEAGRHYESLLDFLLHNDAGLFQTEPGGYINNLVPELQNR